MSAPTTPKRQRRRDVNKGYSPPSHTLDDVPGTPGPIKARINHLSGQVQELVRKQGVAERKHRAEIMLVERRLEESRDQVAVLQQKVGEESKLAARARKEVERCKNEGDGMRSELNLHSLVQQQKALLALSEEKLQMVELEQRLVQSEAARVMRDHKLSLFQSREGDLAAEINGKDARIARLEDELATANTSLAHQRAAEGKAQALVSSTQGESRAEIITLEAKIAKLEEANNALQEKERVTLAQVSKLEESKRSLKEKEREARAEVERLSAEGKESSSSDKEVAELRAQLRTTKAEAAKAVAKASDAEEELELLKETSKEKEKALKAKYREAQEERLRLAVVEEELEALKAASAKTTKKESTRKKAAASTADESDAPKKKRVTRSSTSPEKPVSKKEKVRKTSPVESASEDEAPKKKPKKVTSKAKALRESDSDNKAKEDDAASDSDTPAAPPKEAAVPEKKKKRKLFGAQPAFQWDPIMSSGDGVIPTFLSPVKPMGRTVGTIPRSLSSRRF